MPYLRAPYYVWIGHVPQLATVLEENRVEAPPMFPPTFLYTQSWEDPRPDMEVRSCQLIAVDRPAYLCSTKMFQSLYSGVT